MNKTCFVFIISFLFLLFSATAQNLYTARAYWEEFNKESYKKIRDKKEKGEFLSDEEKFYLTDYETYLFNYFQRMSEEEKQKFEQMKGRWDAESRQQTAKPTASATPQPQDFNWRPKDRVHNGLYGLYYGIALAAITRSNSNVTAGLPFITAGLWQLGPVLNPKKYEGIGPSTMRAAGTGKILGLGYGIGLGLALAGNSTNSGDFLLGFSTLGSIGLGEAAFQIQKRRKYSEGRIELVRHYGFLGPAVGLLTVAATSNNNANTSGISILAGGIGGMILGNHAAKKYAYTVGDVDAISSHTWIYAGIGFAFTGESLQHGSASQSLLFAPAATAVMGTILGQRMVRGVNLTTRQGSMINLASGGAALIGLGVVTMARTPSIGLAIGVPSVFALVAHQLVLHNYKLKNLQQGVGLGRNSKHPVQFALKVTPENYFANLKLNPERLVTVGGAPVLANPIVKLSFTF